MALHHPSFGGFVLRHVRLCLPPPSPSIQSRPGWTQFALHESVECYSLVRHTHKALLRGRADRGWEFCIVRLVYLPASISGDWICERGFNLYLGDAMADAETLLEISLHTSSAGVH